MAVTQINELAVTGTSAGSAWFAMDKEVSPGVYQTQKIAGENIGGNLFSQALTLGANRQHDMNGFGLTFLKSNFEFRASDGLSSGKSLIVRNHTNTANMFEVQNNGDSNFGNTSNPYTNLRTRGSAGAYNWVISGTSTVGLYNEGAGFQGLYFSPGSSMLFLNGSSGSSIVGRIHTNGNWLIEANPYTGAGFEPSMRFGVVSRGITEASGTCFKLKHLNTVSEVVEFTSLNSTNDGYIIQRINTSAIADARLENSQFSFSIDEGTDIVTMKIKKSNGTVITKTLI